MRNRFLLSVRIKFQLIHRRWANPDLINQLADRFGVQAIVVGIDSWLSRKSGKYWVNQYTGDEKADSSNDLADSGLGTGSAKAWCR